MQLGGMAAAAAETFVGALIADPAGVTVAPADRVMLDYALKLTLRPSEMVPDDVDALRAAGFDDRATHDICAITAYYAFVNRIADGLGVEVEGP